MRIPFLRSGGRRSAVSERLGGLFLTDNYSNGALDGGQCLSSEGGMGIEQRLPPAVVGVYDKPQAFLGGEKLLVVHDGKVIYDGQQLGEVTEGPKTVARVGRRIVIFPDKLYVDEKKGELLPMEAEVSGVGFVFGSNTISKNGGEPWPFRSGDAVEISGCSVHPGNDLTLIVRKTEGQVLTFDDNAFDEGTETGEVTVARRVPSLEVMCESGNRLWGCAGDTIYASKPGDPLNFYVYDGLSTDSYALGVGSGGFTACGQYGSHVIFFKEDTACKIYGTRPSNYQLMTTRIPGVAKGCAGTLWVDSEDMYYFGGGGLYAYSGGVPRLLSAQLGFIKAEEACGGVWKGKYYLSVKGLGTLVYDIAASKWLPWGPEEGVGMARTDGGMFMLERGGRLLQLDEGQDGEEWSARLRPFKDGDNRHVTYLSLVIDARPEDRAWMAVEVSFDGGAFKQLALFDGRHRGIRPVYLPPNRGQRLAVRLKGRGRCPVYAIERIFKLGSETE